MSNALPTDRSRRAGVVGLGLIGGSAALALRENGWWVAGEDVDPAIAERALAEGVVDHIGIPADVSISIVSTPVDNVAAEVDRLLSATSGLVIDTGSVKGQIADAVDSIRFVPTHPMAGSEQSGLGGARADLFRGASWVMTPDDEVDDGALAFVHDLIVELGADPITLAPDAHDRMVATVSHVPHLAAAALMTVADRRSSEHRAMLRLAAGGFRDMTRIAAGSPDIWPPICLQNASAIGAALDEVLSELQALRLAIADADSSTLRSTFADAREARLNLPSARALPPNLAEVRTRIKDRKGELAVLTGLAAEQGVNIFDLEIAHSAEGPTGVIVMLVDADVAEDFALTLRDNDYRPSVRVLT